MGEILIEDGCNVQEGCVVHVFPGATVVLRIIEQLGDSVATPTEAREILGLSGARN